MVLWIPLEASHPLPSKKSAWAFPKLHLRASSQGKASSNDSANFRLDRCLPWLTKQGVSCLLHPSEVTTERQGQFLNITLQLFPLLSSCSKLPAVPAPAVSLQVPWSPASRIFHCNSWHDNVAQRTHKRGKGKSCFTLGAKIACGTIQLAKVPWIASPSCRGCSHAQILNPRHCSSLARKLAQAENNYAFNVWKRGGFSDRTKEVL